MKVGAFAVISAATLALAACGQKTDTEASTSTSNGMVTGLNNDAAAVSPAASGGQIFANAAAASDAFEIATSNLALTASSSTAIKKFAQKMIEAHTDSTAKLKTASSAATPAITPDPTLTAEQQAKLDALKATSGKAFDQAYIAAQAEGHQKTLDALQSYASTGDVPELKSFASTLVPIVAAHLNMAKGLKA